MTTRQAVADRPVARRALRAVARKVLLFLSVCVVIAVLWQGGLALAGISPFIGKTPGDVWEYLVTAPQAAANRAEVLRGLGVTLHDAAIGYLAGLAGAALIAILFTLFPVAATTFLPVAMVLRTFPLVALTPLVTLAFGRGAGGLAAIGFVVVFFAALVTISFGLASAPRQVLDAVRVFGGGRWARVLKVGVPHALPAFFTAARIAIPQSISAALIAEWLVTGSGSGAQLMRASGAFRYAPLWSVAVVLILVATVVYTIVSTIEEIVLLRLIGNPE